MGSRRALVPVAAAAVVLLCPGAAAAHPLGAPPTATLSAEARTVHVRWRAQPDDAALVAARDRERYLLERIEVWQEGVACGGAVASAADLVTDGAALAFACPREVRVVDVAITMLHDRHPAYRTFAQSPGDTRTRRSVFTVDAPRHAWDFRPAAARGGAAMAGWAEPLALAVAALAAAAAALRLRGRRRTGAAA